MRFALVDDKKELRDHVAMLLGKFAAEQRLHYKLDCFASGEDFLNHFTAHSYDIIFMDIFMDGMDGVETAEQIRKFDSHVILIFLTSSQDHMKMRFRVMPLIMWKNRWIWNRSRIVFSMH